MAHVIQVARPEMAEIKFLGLLGVFTTLFRKHTDQDKIPEFSAKIKQIPRICFKLNLTMLVAILATWDFQDLQND